MPLFFEWPNTISILTIFLGISFLYFGMTCLTTDFMKAEFERYGLKEQRILVGILQLVGAAGVLLGWYSSPILCGIASAGLFVLMTGGFIVRLKIKDSFLQSLPSFLYALLSLYLAYYYF